MSYSEVEYWEAEVTVTCTSCTEDYDFTVLCERADDCEEADDGLTLELEANGWVCSDTDDTCPDCANI